MRIDKEHKRGDTIEVKRGPYTGLKVTLNRYDSRNDAWYATDEDGKAHFKKIMVYGDEI
jgi:hypothetical protein